jgi:hypothetical protein
MPTINQLVGQWRGWINRSKSFDGKELDELENHLLEEIDYLTEKDGFTEEEAFGKAVIEMGKRENLDQEFTKVRGLPVQKIKHWFMIHSWIIGALIVALVVAQIDFTPKEKPLPFLDTKSIGDCTWPSDFYAFPRTVPSGNKTYFSDSFHGNIYTFDCGSNSEINVGMTGSYFAEFPDNLQFFTFDIDHQNRFYFLGQNKKTSDNTYQYFISVYFNSQLEKNIPILELEKTRINYSLIKILDSTVILLRNHFDSNSVETQVVSNDIIYFDLNDAERKISIKKVDDEIYDIDRSGNKLAVLTHDGTIKIFTLQNKQLVETKTMEVKGFSDLENREACISISYCAKNDQIVLKSYRMKSLNYYLLPINDKQLELVSLQKTNKRYLSERIFKEKGLHSIVNIDKEVRGVLKINYLGEERLVLVKYDNPSGWEYGNVYLFK